MACGDNEQWCSSSKVKRKITKEEQSEHGPLKINMTILIFHHTTESSYINISNNELFFEYYEVIKYGRT